MASEPHPLEEPTWSVTRAITVLALATIGIAVMSEILVGATRGVTATLPLTETFLGLIIISLLLAVIANVVQVVLRKIFQRNIFHSRIEKPLAS